MSVRRLPGSDFSISRRMESWRTQRREQVPEQGELISEVREAAGPALVRRAYQIDGPGVSKPDVTPSQENTSLRVLVASCEILSRRPATADLRSNPVGPAT